MRLSLNIKLNLLFLLTILIVLLSTVSAAVFIFREEISTLYRNDLSERLRLVEIDYAASDAVSSASEDVSAVQADVLESLNEKYLQLGESRLSPFIVNGDGEIILSLEDALINEILLSSEKSLLLDGDEGEFLFESSLGTQWVIFSYYEDWDWYTGYILADSHRMASLWRFSRQITLIIVIISLFLFFLITWMTGSLVRRMRRISDHTDIILKGEIERRLVIDRKDEVGSLAEKFNVFTDHLMDIIRGIQVSRDESGRIRDELSQVISRTASLMNNIDSQTGGISRGIGQLNTEIQESGKSLSTISNQVDELNGKADTQLSTVMSSSNLIKQLGSELETLSGNLTVQKEFSGSLVLLARDGQSHLTDTNRVIQEMNSNINEIVGLVEMIQSIADQTNLLAMNAAIEAAHAGESGKGFAVVADEIRKLATQSSENSKSIDERIGRIVARARDAGEAGHQTEETFSSILSRIDDVSGSLDESDSSANRMAGQFHELDRSIQDLRISAEEVKKTAALTDSEIPVISEGFRSAGSIARDVMGSITQIDESSSRQVENINQASATLDLLQDTIDTLKKQISIFTAHGDPS